MTADEWHHVLVSYDIGGSVTAEGDQSATSGAFGKILRADPKMWLAFDDVNYTREHWGNGVIESGGSSGILDLLGPNDLATDNSGATAATHAPFDQIGQEIASFAPGINSHTGIVTRQDRVGYQKPTYSYSPGPVLASAAPLGIPAASRYADQVYHCEMAEFQVWTGVAIDTDDENYRRLFIGHDGQPVDPSEAAHVLGQPVVLLHTSKKWIAGTNDGSLGGGASPSGDFTPTGTIKAYKPDPSLHGPQGEPQIAKRSQMRLSKKPNPARTQTVTPSEPDAV